MAQPRFPGHRQFRYNFDIVIPPLQNPSEEDCATHSQLYNVMKIDGRIKVIEIVGGAKKSRKYPKNEKVKNIPSSTAILYYIFDKIR